MMEFWPENQGQSHLYSKFGTVPGRNCTHNYHDRHQATHYPLYYGEQQQDQGRESSYWTVPGSRTGGALHEYTNWTDSELTVPSSSSSSSSHFPFILDRHPQHHQDLGEYQPHEARDWTAAHRATRDYERGFLREGWQRRWEPCNPIRYNREISAKRNDSSYRELEAWATRYSHSLPRRRRIEAELRGASQGLVESSRSGIDHQVATLQHVRPSASIRESGLWDREGRKQAQALYPSQTPAPDTSHMLDLKENTGYQRRIFSQPPGYIAPPPYNSPHKSSPVSHHCDSRWQQDSTKQTYWSQPMLKKQDVPARESKSEKDKFTKPDESKTNTKLEELKHQKQEMDTLQTGSPITVQNIDSEHQRILSPQHPQAVQISKPIKETSSKVIEGRKFRLNKKTGGMTIFCLVSRIAGTTETPSLPLCTSPTNIQSTETGEVSKGLRDIGKVNQVLKLADEVDLTAPTFLEQSNPSDVTKLPNKQEETPTCTEKESLGDNLPNKAETDVTSPEKANTNDVESTIGRQVGQSVQPVSAKYPLWREPSFTSRGDISSTSCLKVNHEEEESEVVQKQQDCVNVSNHPIDIEVRRLDIKEDTEDNKGLMVIDTTCVVVKMELIPSPKKEHVHYLGSTANTEDGSFDVETNISPESNCQLNPDVTSDQSSGNIPSQTNQSPQTDLESIVLEKDIHSEESEFSFPCTVSSPVCETLEERTERIIGIPLDDCIAEQQPKDVPSIPDFCAEEHSEEAGPSPIKNNIHDTTEQPSEDTIEEEQSQNQLEVIQMENVVSLTDSDEARDQETNEDGEDFSGSQEKVSDMPEENKTDSRLETDLKSSSELEITEDLPLESTDDKGQCDTSEKENQPVEDDQSSQPPDLSNSSSLSPPGLASSLSISGSDTEEGPDPELAPLSPAANLTPQFEILSFPQTPLHPPQSLLLPGTTDSSGSSTPHTDHSPSLPPPPLDLIDQTGETACDLDQDEEGENEISNESLTIDMTDKEVLQQQLECDQLENAACITDEQQTKEPDEIPAKEPDDKLDNAACITDEQQTKEPDEIPAKEPDDKLDNAACITNEQQTKEPDEITFRDEIPGSSSGSSTPHTDHSPSLPPPPPLDLIDQTGETACDLDQDEEGESEISNEFLTIDMTDKEVLQQQLECDQLDNAACITDEQQTKEPHEIPAKEPDEITFRDEIPEPDEIPAGDLEQNLDKSNEMAIDVISFQQHLECVESEGAACATENGMTEEQSPQEVSDDSTGLSVQSSETEEEIEESLSDRQIEVNIFQQKFDDNQEEDVFCVTESCMIEDQTQEVPLDLWEQTICKNNAKESQTQIETEILPDTEPGTEPSNPSPPLASDSEMSHSALDGHSLTELPSPTHASHESNTEFISLLNIDSGCSSPLNPNTAADTVPLPVDACEESLQFSSSPLSNSPPVLPSSSTPPLLQEESVSDISSTAAHKEELEYPKSLWDVVTRIRKHTAPDSENEEEEVSEPWDPEHVGEDLVCPDVIVDSEEIIFDEKEQQEVSMDSAGVGTQEYNEPSGHGDEDTLSCSSTSSHSSGDTVIEADEDEVEETTHDAVTENKSEEENEEFNTVEGELCCSGESAAEENETAQDESNTDKTCQSEECQVEGENKTTGVEKMMETDTAEIVTVSDEVKD